MGRWRLRFCQRQLATTERVDTTQSCRIGCVTTARLLYRYDDLDGVECETAEGDGGRCVQGICFRQCPDDAHLFAHTLHDCHESRLHAELSHKSLPSAAVVLPVPEKQTTTTSTTSSPAQEPEEEEETGQDYGGEEAECEMRFVPKRTARNPGEQVASFMTDVDHAAQLCAMHNSCYFADVRHSPSLNFCAIHLGSSSSCRDGSDGDGRRRDACGCSRTRKSRRPSSSATLGIAEWSCCCADATGWRRGMRV